MKKKFSTSWKASSQPRKQRKYKANAPLHLKKKLVSVNLSKPLRKEQGKRNIQIKKGDKVKIMRGKYKGKTGKIMEVNLKYSKVYIENIQVTKMDNSKANVPLRSSNLQIIELAERSKQKIKENKNKEVKKETPKKGDSKPKSEEKKK